MRFGCPLATRKLRRTDHFASSTCVMCCMSTTSSGISRTTCGLCTSLTSRLTSASPMSSQSSIRMIVKPIQLNKTCSTWSRSMIELRTPRFLSRTSRERECSQTQSRSTTASESKRRRSTACAQATRMTMVVLPTRWASLTTSAIATSQILSKQCKITTFPKSCSITAPAPSSWAAIQEKPWFKRTSCVLKSKPRSTTSLWKQAKRPDFKYLL